MLATALGEIESATHAVVYVRDGALLDYGDLRTCESAYRGLEREVSVVPMTADHKEQASAHKVRAYRDNPSR